MSRRGQCLAVAYLTTTEAWPNRIVKRADVAPDQLLANPKNYRRHTREQKNAFRGLVAEVGYIDPVLCTLDDVVIDGHLRVEVALEDGIPTIPVDYYDGTEAQSDLILATKDPLAAMAYHDAAQLKSLLDEVSTSDAAVMAMISGLAEDEGIIPVDAPADFASYDETIETEHQCPKCGYAWSGKSS